MSDRTLFVTGKLARPRLEKLLDGLALPGPWEIADIGVKVAALMTEPILMRRLAVPAGTGRVILPGRARVDLARLSAHFGAPFERGPDELKDLPGYLGRAGPPPDLSRHDMRIFAEIVDAPALSVAAVVAKARIYVAQGADVIDIGGLPGTPFPQLADVVRALKAEGFAVSVDSADIEELRTGAAAGADFLLSLTEETLWLARESAAVPVIIPAPHGDLDSLVRAAETLDKLGRPYLADPILDPIHFGFTTAILRYAEFRRRMPQAEMFMGTGNLTELTDADTGGIAMMLLGICSELGIRNLLTVQVSPHTRRTVAEHDAARRILFAAREDGALPQGYSPALLGLHERAPFVDTPEEIAALASQIRDENYRIEVAEDGIHIFNRDRHVIGQEPFGFYPQLPLGGDAGHAFYLGAELARAETAWQLGKRYTQDEGLRWGVAADVAEEDKTRLKEAGTTLSHALRPSPSGSGGSAYGGGSKTDKSSGSETA